MIIFYKHLNKFMNGCLLTFVSQMQFTKIKLFIKISRDRNLYGIVNDNLIKLLFFLGV